MKEVQSKLLAIYYAIYAVFIIGLVLNVLALQAQDYERLNERSPMGTARYVGMAGAMTAVGADPSAAADNPAGLGFYRHSELLFSIGGAFDRTCQEGLTFSVSGEAAFEAVCNGDATSLESFKQPKMKLFNGELVVVLRPTTKAGKATLTVKDQRGRMKPAILTIETTK